jgi:hypothetical protein
VKFAVLKKEGVEAVVEIVVEIFLWTHLRQDLLHNELVVLMISSSV